ncbi:MAG TPA: iron-sulfur cluster repair di-iron protein [Terriglobales bacterium]|nr:iron-sulfur cluster repair di-iron protein [Terriglobales bacterium]
MYDTSKTVREYAVEIPQSVRVFEKLGIDYCCGGGKSLSEACAQIKVPVEQVLSSLSAIVTPELNGASDWKQAPLSDLVDHIVTKHHAYVKQELPRLDLLLNKVAGKHAEKHPELKRVLIVFGTMRDELNSHLLKEEQILFPYIKQLESNGQRRAMFGSVRNPIHMMEIEHDSAGEALRELRQITNQFTAPEEGCFSYKTLYQGLVEFEADLHQHIHLENNILFPRAIELEGVGK